MPAGRKFYFPQGDYRSRHADPALTILVACTGGGGGGDDGDDDANPNPDEDRAGCDGATFLGTSTDPGDPGPWAVGARTVQIGRLKVEVWYPAPPASADGLEPERYDIREALGALRGEIPDADNPWQECDCVRDLPLDEEHGPYPLVLFVHGTAAFRHQSLTHMTHWASRGFVVAAADHPGLMLGDFLSQLCPGDPSGAQDLGGDLDAMLGAFAETGGDLAFLAGRVDVTRVGVVGHSAGGGAAAAASTKPGVALVVPLAANGTSQAPSLYMGGESDTIAQFSQTTSAWNGSVTPKYLVGIENTGHLFCSDLCDTRNARGQNLLEIAEEHQLCGSEFASFLFDCEPTYLAGDTARAIVSWATSNALETTLQCRDDLPALGTIDDEFAEVATYQEAL
jgi:predicted dienelactone hydrolase